MPKKDRQAMLERRELILNHALEQFAVKGFEKTTIDDIAGSAGISKGGIYVHFNSKEEIFMGIAERVTESRKSVVKAVSAEVCHQARVRSYIVDILNSYLQEDNFKRIRFSFEFWLKSRMGKAGEGKSIKEFNDNRFSIVMNGIKGMLKDGAGAGVFRKDVDSVSIAYIIMAAIDGMAFYKGVMDKSYSEKTAKEFADMVVNHIVKGGVNG